MKKVIFQIAVVCIMLLILIPSALHLTGIEFTKFKYENILQITVLVGLIICVPCTLIGTLKRRENISGKVFKVIATLTLTIVAAYIAVVLFTSKGIWKNEKTLYTNKKEKNVSLVQREFSLSGVIIDPPEIKEFKVKELNEYLIIAREIDINQIDPNEWVKAE